MFVSTGCREGLRCRPKTCPSSMHQATSLASIARHHHKFDQQHGAIRLIKEQFASGKSLLCPEENMARGARSRILGKPAAGPPPARTATWAHRIENRTFTTDSSCVKHPGHGLAVATATQVHLCTLEGASGTCGKASSVDPCEQHGVGRVAIVYVFARGTFALCWDVHSLATSPTAPLTPDVNLEAVHACSSMKGTPLATRTEAAT